MRVKNSAKLDCCVLTAAEISCWREATHFNELNWFNLPRALDLSKNAKTQGSNILIVS